MNSTNNLGDDAQADRDLTNAQVPPHVFNVRLPADLIEYIETGVDKTGQYTHPLTLWEKLSVILGYAFIIMMFLAGLLGGGVGKHLFEWLFH